jgi:hypothetical protein
MFRLAIAMMNQRRYQMYNCLDLKMCGIGKSTSELLLSHIIPIKAAIWGYTLSGTLPQISVHHLGWSSSNL